MSPRQRPTTLAATKTAIVVADEPSLNGHLEIVCSAYEPGRSYLSHQYFRAPFHISKPYWDDHALMVQVVNPTAGLFAGDRLRCEARVETGARLHLCTPSASRVHTMPSGRAEVEHTFHVAGGGWLEFLPCPLIPQAGSRYRQSTRVHIEAGGEFFCVEIVTPGRVAHGEAFCYREIDWLCELIYDRRLVARERFFLRPDNDSTKPLRNPFSQSYFASAYLISERITPDDACWQQIRELNSPDVLIGSSRLSAAGWSIKVLARDSLALNSAIQSTRRILSVGISPLQSKARKA